MDRTKQPGLQIAQIMLLGAKFSHRKDALALPANTPIHELPINIEAKVSGKAGDPAAALRLRAFTPHDRADLLYALDVEVLLVVTAVPGQENLEPFEYARSGGLATLFPFLREAVANITLKGRFGAVWLKPINLQAAIGKSDWAEFDDDEKATAGAASPAADS